MYGELEAIRDEKTYLMDRLTRTTKEMLGKKSKKKKRVNPIKKDKFTRTNPGFLHKDSQLLDAGMLSLNDHALTRTLKSSKVRSMSAADDCWDRPDSGTQSFHRRNSKMRSKTIYGSSGYENNLEHTIGRAAFDPKAATSRTRSIGRKRASSRCTARWRMNCQTRKLTGEPRPSRAPAGTR